MIKFENVENYRENNRIEAKKAVGGLPESIWETYSAFANTMGGIILLGVEEHRDKTFHMATLPDPEALIEDFWERIADRKTVSRNILRDEDVTIEEAEGKKMVAIRVPRAKREERPIYIDGSLMTGTYKRNGEGDYRCTPDEIRRMLNAAAKEPPLWMREIASYVRRIVGYLTEHITGTLPELASLLGETEEDVEDLLLELWEQEIVTVQDGIYRLKA